MTTEQEIRERIAKLLGEFPDGKVMYSDVTDVQRHTRTHEKVPPRPQGDRRRFQRLPAHAASPRNGGACQAVLAAVNIAIKVLKEVPRTDLLAERNTESRVVTRETKELKGISTEEILKRIRRDTATGKGSVLDLIRLITGFNSGNASVVWARLTSMHPHAIEWSCVVINGSGRPTPVADDESLAWIVKRQRDLKSYYPAKKDSATQIVYIATEPRFALFKIGMWRGSNKGLRDRYITPYGQYLSLTMWNCEDSREAEKDLKTQIAPFHDSCELYLKGSASVNLAAAFEYLDSMYERREESE